MRVGVGVELAHGLFRLPGGGHLAAWVAGTQQTEQLLPTMIIEALVGLGEQPPAAVERIGLSTAMTHRLVLHPTAALVELGVGELSELAASVALAGTEGAKVRASLGAKALMA